MSATSLAQNECLLSKANVAVPRIQAGCYGNGDQQFPHILTYQLRRATLWDGCNADCWCCHDDWLFDYREYKWHGVVVLRRCGAGAGVSLLGNREQFGPDRKHQVNVPRWLVELNVQILHGEAWSYRCISALYSWSWVNDRWSEYNEEWKHRYL